MFSVRGDQLPHITQIAGQAVEAGLQFNQYVVLEVPISPSAERITKICMRNQTEMLVNGQSVNSVGIRQALGDFICWLKLFNNVVLVAHNGRRFDFVVLTSALFNCVIFEEFQAVVTALVDYMPVFKSVLKGQDSYTQEILVRNILHEEYEAHNAIHDVRCLSLLVDHVVNIDSKCFMHKSFLTKDIMLNIQTTKEMKLNMPSLSAQIYKGIMKMCTVEHVASSGLNLSHLKTIYKRKREDGLYNVFQMKNNLDQPRVTNVKSKH